MQNDTRQIIIVGSGPAGLTAAIYAGRANLKPLVIDGKKPGGQLMWTTAVENWPGNISIMGPELMMNMREHAKHFGTEFSDRTITSVDFSQRPFVLFTDQDEELRAHAVIIATGATPRRLGVVGEDEYLGKGVATCAVCDAAFYRDKKVLVVGGGDVAMENATFLRKFTDAVTVVHILDELTASVPMQKRVLDDGVELIYSTTVTEITGDGNQVTGVVLTDQKTGEKTTREFDGVFISIGLIPNTKPFEGQVALNKQGYIEIVKHTQTSVEGVFVAGDAHDYRYRQAITSSGSGCMASLDAEMYLKEQV